MAPRKRGPKTRKCDSLKKKAKETPSFSVPDDVVEHIFSFLPIKEAVQNGVVSTRFKDSWQLSRILDFGDDQCRFDFVETIDKAFDRHRGSQIQSFILDIDPTGIKISIENWIRRSVEKGVEDLQLDFTKGDRILILETDLSTIETLRILKLRYVLFQTPETLKGLKFLHTFVLNQTFVDYDTIDSVCRNCFHLNRLELIDCPELWELTIRGRLLKNFKSFTLARCTDLNWVVIDAPSLEAFHYNGLVCELRFVHVHNLKSVFLDYEKDRDMVRSLGVAPIVISLCHISVLSTTSVLLEGMTKRVVEGEFIEADFKCWNLEEFQIFMASPSYCNLFDIANFLKNCPSLQRFYLDINNFTFECGMYWETHQKQLVEEIPSYKLDSLKYIEIKGFKGHRHELDIVKFFLRKSTWLETLVLVTPKKTKTRIYYPDYDTISDLRELSVNATIRVFEDFRYNSLIPPKHNKKRF